MKYLLIMDASKHSTIDCLFYENHPTIQSCKNRIQQLLADNMLYEGDSKHKIHVIFIGKKINTGDYIRIKRSYDGIHWENMNEAYHKSYSKRERK